MKIISKLDQLVDILTPEILLDIISNMFGINHMNFNSWIDLGFDDLDEIQFLIEIEKIFNCEIKDDLIMSIYIEVSPKDLYKLVIRNKNFDKLGI